VFGARICTVLFGLVASTWDFFLLSSAWFRCSALTYLCKLATGDGVGDHSVLAIALAYFYSFSSF